MVAPNGKPYISRFTNSYGEEWVFEYDHAAGEGVISGSDIDWEKMRVLDGRVLALVLNQKELEWLRGAWAEAIGSGNPGQVST